MRLKTATRSSAFASLPWAISSNLGRRRFMSIRRRQRQFSILPRVPGRAKSIATIICVVPKEIDGKLMCSEAPTPEPARDLCIRSMEL